jgi:hypothetical protein
MTALEIIDILRRGASSLADSLEFYWPTTEENEVAEANQVVHMGRAFMDSGFKVYAEAHKEGVSDQRFDLLAIDPSQTALVVAEFKRVYNGPQCDLMASDAERLKSFEPVQGQRHQVRGATLGERWGVVAGTTWRAEYAAWFLSKDRLAEDPTRTGGLNQLWSAVKGTQAKWGAFPLIAYHRASEVNTQWLLYVVFRLS